MQPLPTNSIISVPQPIPFDYIYSGSTAMIESAPETCGVRVLHNPYLEVDRLLAHIDKYYFVPESPDKKLIIPPFWKRTFRELFKTKAGWFGDSNPGFYYREGIVSTARKTAKTTSVAAMVRAILECIEAFEGMKNFTIPNYSPGLAPGSVMMSQLNRLGDIYYMKTGTYQANNYDLNDYDIPCAVYVKDPTADQRGTGSLKIKNVATERTFHILAGSPVSMVGNIGRFLNLTDESGLATGNKKDIFTTLLTGRSESLILHIGIRGKVNSFLNNRIDELRKLNQPHKHYLSIHAADPKACRTEEGMRDEKQWRSANPTLGLDWNSIAAYKDSCDEHLNSGNAQAAERWKTYFLNLPSLQSEVVELWTAEDLHVLDAPETPAKGRCWLGLDLALVNDLCCLTAYYEGSGLTDMYAWVPGQESLEHYQNKYDYPLLELEKEGRVFKTEGTLINFERVQEFIIQLLKRTGQPIGAVVLLADRYRAEGWKESLKKLGLVSGVNFPLVIHASQGSIMMESFINRFRIKVKTEELRFGGLPLLYSACERAEITKDSNGNKKFDRSNPASARIDALISTLLAVNAEFFCTKILKPEEWMIIKQMIQQAERLHAQSQGSTSP